MILFLKIREKDGLASPSSGLGTKNQWEPASAWGGIRVSVLWIDRDEAFCFQQLTNPGPSALSECRQWSPRSSDVNSFTARIQEVVQSQKDLADTLALKNAKMRVEQLGRIALGDVYQAQSEAIDALGTAGTAALPEILQVMDKPPAFFYDGDKLIRVFVEAAGEDRGRQLHARLQQDVLYWKAMAPTLTRDWLGQLIVVGSPLFVKFNETVLLVRELDREDYAPAAKTIADLRDFWVSQTQLYDPKWDGGGQSSSVTGLDVVHTDAVRLAKECDAFLKHAKNRANAPSRD